MASSNTIDHTLPTNNMHNTYTHVHDVVFFTDSICTTVTNDPHSASRWVSQIQHIHRRRRRLVVGLDTEWRRADNAAATVQICVGRRCLIFQLLHAPWIPKQLVDFVTNPNHTIVGVGVDEDVKKFAVECQLGTLSGTNMVDLRDLAAVRYVDPELKRAGLKRLGIIVLNKEMEKPKKVTLSRWDKKWLTHSQIEYACIDAFVSFEIGRVLNASSFSQSDNWEW